jgi:hypothetical protein
VPPSSEAYICTCILRRSDSGLAGECSNSFRSIGSKGFPFQRLCWPGDPDLFYFRSEQNLMSQIFTYAAVACHEKYICVSGTESICFKTASSPLPVYVRKTEQLDERPSHDCKNFVLPSLNQLYHGVCTHGNLRTIHHLATLAKCH